MPENPYESPASGPPNATQRSEGFEYLRLLLELACYFLAAAWFFVLARLGVSSDFVQFPLWMKLVLTASTVGIGGGALGCLILRLKTKASRFSVVSITAGAMAMLLFCPCSGLGILVMWYWN